MTRTQVKKKAGPKASPKVVPTSQKLWYKTLRRFLVKAGACRRERALALKRARRHKTFRSLWENRNPPPDGYPEWDVLSDRRWVIDELTWDDIIDTANLNIDAAHVRVIPPGTIYDYHDDTKCWCTNLAQLLERFPANLVYREMAKAVKAGVKEGNYL